MGAFADFVARLRRNAGLPPLYKTVARDPSEAVAEPCEEGPEDAPAPAYAGEAEAPA